CVGQLRAIVEGWIVTPQDLLVIDGILRRKSILLLTEKTQAVEVIAGPLQRLLGLVTVLVGIAPPRRFTRIAVRDITVAEGEALLAALSLAGQHPLPDGV